MNVRLRALLDTVLFVVYCIAIYFTTYFLMENFGRTGFYIVAAAFTAYLLYIVYGICLARRKYKALKDSK